MNRAIVWFCHSQFLFNWMQNTYAFIVCSLAHTDIRNDFIPCLWRIEFVHVWMLNMVNEKIVWMRVRKCHIHDIQPARTFTAPQIGRKLSRDSFWALYSYISLARFRLFLLVTFLIWNFLANAHSTNISFVCRIPPLDIPFFLRRRIITIVITFALPSTNGDLSNQSDLEGVRESIMCEMRNFRMRDGPHFKGIFHHEPFFDSMGRNVASSTWLIVFHSTHLSRCIL